MAEAAAETVNGLAAAATVDTMAAAEDTMAVVVDTMVAAVGTMAAAEAETEAVVPAADTLAVPTADTTAAPDGNLADVLAEKEEGGAAPAGRRRPTAPAATAATSGSGGAAASAVALLPLAGVVTVARRVLNERGLTLAGPTKSALANAAAIYILYLTTMCVRPCADGACRLLPHTPHYTL